MTNPYFTPTEQGYDDAEREVQDLVRSLVYAMPYDKYSTIIGRPAEHSLEIVFDDAGFQAAVETVMEWHPDIQDLDDDYYPCSSFLINAVENY